MPRYAALALMVSAAVGPAAAQQAAWPAKAVRMVVAFPPGGPTDIIARSMGPRLTEAWGQPVIIDNRGGAGGNIGTEHVARSAPDGYTLLMVASTHVINPSVYPKPGYDAIRDFAPVALVGRSPFILVVHPSIPARSVKELVALARARPAQVSCASASSGSGNHLACELLKLMEKVDIVHVPYKGAGPATADLLGGHVSMMFNAMPPAMPHVQSGRLRALAVSGLKRSPVVPELPTMDETGLRGFDVETWYALLGPAGLARDIVTRANADTLRVLRQPEFAERLKAQGVEPAGGTPEQLGEFLQSELTKFARVARAAGARVD